ncbi:MAG TPA: hypothetical protein VF487_10885 [Chitinophagaceae bacterium]
MFNLFKKKEAGTRVTDRIWMNENAKLESFTKEWRKNNDILYISWFEDTYAKIESLFIQENIQANCLAMTRELSPSIITGKTIVFAEHYPLHEKENAIYQKLNLQQVIVWSALDEPLFKHFGGDKIIAMMKQLGMSEDAAIEHVMISKAIQNAQEKIAKKVTTEQAARSQTDWLQRNLPP